MPKRDLPLKKLHKSSIVFIASITLQALGKMA